MLDGVKTFVLHKLTLRVAYILAAFSSAKLISFTSSETVQQALFSAGITFSIHNPDALKTYISGAVLIGGEFVYHWIHKTFILPKVSK